jgi:hypothetical protein
VTDVTDVTDVLTALANIVTLNERGDELVQDAADDVVPVVTEEF